MVVDKDSFEGLNCMLGVYGPAWGLLSHRRWTIVHVRGGKAKLGTGCQDAIIDVDFQDADISALTLIVITSCTFDHQSLSFEAGQMGGEV